MGRDFGAVSQTDLNRSLAPSVVQATRLIGKSVEKGKSSEAEKGL